MPTDEPTATDNCDNNVTLNVLDSRASGCMCIRTGNYQSMDCDRCMWNVASTASQTITLQDSEAPVLANIPVDVTIECDQPLPSDEPTATDNCDTDVTITLVDTEVPGACPQEKVITCTWTATDDCGNASTASQVITIQDSEAPVLANIPVDVTIECDQPLPTDEPTATDNVIIM
ncbi:MAG: hypothetical protein R2784_14115 [Saprospiraceae bacterium]